MVYAAVYGPMEIRAGKQDTDKLVIEVVVRPASGAPSSADKEREVTIRRALEHVVKTAAHPRCGIRVVLQTVSSDGGIDAILLNAACAALIDASVDVTGVLCASSLAVLPGVGVVVDPTEDEETAATATATMAYNFRGEGVANENGDGGLLPAMAAPEAEAEVLTTLTRGVFSEEAFLEMTVTGRDAAAAAFTFMMEAHDRYLAAQEAHMTTGLTARIEALALELEREQRGAGGGGGGKGARGGGGGGEGGGGEGGGGEGGGGEGGGRTTFDGGEQKEVEAA